LEGTGDQEAVKGNEKQIEAEVEGEFRSRQRSAVSYSPFTMGGRPIERQRENVLPLPLSLWQGGFRKRLTSHMEYGTSFADRGSLKKVS
jgi:hypothetical protein